MKTSLSLIAVWILSLTLATADTMQLAGMMNSATTTNFSGVSTNIVLICPPSVPNVEGTYTQVGNILGARAWYNTNGYYIWLGNGYFVSYGTNSTAVGWQKRSGPGIPAGVGELYDPYNNTVTGTLAATYAYVTNYTTNTFNFLTLGGVGSQWRGSVVSAAGATATGGTVTNYTLNDTNYRAHIFTNVGTTNFVVSGGSLVCDVLVVAGGAGGANGAGGGGGGGAGGLVYQVARVISGSNSIVVGNGGAGGRAFQAETGWHGSNSVFDTITAVGGGGGGYYNESRGVDGGSGGGNSLVGAPAGSSTQGDSGGGTGFGNAGGLNHGGGGGAGATGVSGAGSEGGAGGSGKNYSISGSDSYYAGGGGGGGGAGGAGGAGGGGAGGGSVGVSGSPNTGGGGGGGAGSSANRGGAGGSGIVIVRYQL